MANFDKREIDSFWMEISEYKSAKDLISMIKKKFLVHIISKCLTPPSSVMCMAWIFLKNWEIEQLSRFIIEIQTIDRIEWSVIQWHILWHIFVSAGEKRNLKTRENKSEIDATWIQSTSNQCYLKFNETDELNRSIKHIIDTS